MNIMENKRGYIVKKDGKWVVAQMVDFPTQIYFECDNGGSWCNPIPIHPSHITNIEQYEGKEVEYRVEGLCGHDNAATQYAIPILSDDKVNVWEEAINAAKQELIGRTYSDSVEYYENLLYILRNNYQLTQTNP